MKTVSTRGLSVRFGAITALRDVNLRISPGEVVAIVGANGSGKSTLLKTIAGFVKPIAGSVFLGDTPVDPLTPARRARLGIRFVDGNVPVFGELTVNQNLRLGAWATHNGYQNFRKATRLILSAFPALSVARQKPASTLSGGEQRQLAVACAMYCSESVLLADELTVGLDDRASADLGGALQSAAAAGSAIAIVEHGQDWVDRYCTRRVELSFGKIVSDTVVSTS